MTYHTAVMAQQRTLRRNRNSIKHQQLRKGLGPIANIVLIVIMITTLGMIYLTQITKSTSYSYQLDELKSRKTQLANQNKDLLFESTRLQALERIRTSSVAKSLEDVTSVDYTPTQ